MAAIPKPGSRDANNAEAKISFDLAGAGTQTFFRKGATRYDVLVSGTVTVIQNTPLGVAVELEEISGSGNVYTTEPFTLRAEGAAEGHVVPVAP